MGIDPEVEVLWGVGCNDSSEPQGQERDGGTPQGWPLSLLLGTLLLDEVNKASGRRGVADPP